MNYMLLIYEAPEARADWSDEDRQNDMKRWFDYSEELVKAGVMVGGDPLHGIDTARTVRNRNGETLTTDGPFAETKEVLGGYYMIDVETADQAAEWGARCPGADYGSIEVRPVMDLSDMQG